MNEQLMQALSQLMATISTGLTQGVAFAQDQLPDVIIQLLWWEGVKSFIFFSITLLVAFILYHLGFVATKARIVEEEAKSKARIADWLATKSNYNRPSEYDIWDDPGCMVPRIICTVLLCTCVPFLLGSLDWLKILIAPKVWLIEYAATLVK